MKIYICSLLLISCVLHSSHGYGKSSDPSTKTGYKDTAVSMVNEDKTSEIESAERDDDLLDLPGDFDEETEHLMDVLDMAVDVISTNRKGKGRPAKKQKQRKEKIADFKNYIKTSRKCEDMESKVELICEKIEVAIKDRILNRLFTKLDKKNSKWKPAGYQMCCSKETATERLNCFNINKMERLAKLCTTKTSKKFHKCCDLSVESRVTCFDSFKKKACSKDTTTPTPTEDPSTVMMSSECKGLWSGISQTKYAGKSSHRGKPTKSDRKEMRNAFSGGYSRTRRNYWSDWRQKKRQEVQQGKRCCQAGQKSTAFFSTISKSQCMENYCTWQTGEPEDTCANKFLWCCMNMGDPSKPKPTTDRPAPTRKSKPLDCCAEGREMSVGAGGMGSKLECYRGQQELKRDIPQLGVRCMASYMKCCLTPNRSGKSDVDTTKEETLKKIPMSQRYRNGLPDGLRQSPSGHYYYVDKARSNIDKVKRVMRMPRVN